MKKTVKVGGKDVINVNPKRVAEGGHYGWSIVVADRGFVWIGETMRMDDDQIFVSNGQNIRQWGTTKGLGQLASFGPTKETELDPIECLFIPMRAVIAIIPANQAKWVWDGSKYTPQSQ